MRTAILSLALLPAIACQEIGAPTGVSDPEATLLADASPTDRGLIVAAATGVQVQLALFAMMGADADHRFGDCPTATITGAESVTFTGEDCVGEESGNRYNGSVIVQNYPTWAYADEMGTEYGEHDATAPTSIVWEALSITSEGDHVIDLDGEMRVDLIDGQTAGSLDVVASIDGGRDVTTRLTMEAGSEDTVTVAEVDGVEFERVESANGVTIASEFETLHLATLPGAAYGGCVLGHLSGGAVVRVCLPSVTLVYPVPE